MSPDGNVNYSYGLGIMNQELLDGLGQPVELTIEVWGKGAEDVRISRTWSDYQQMDDFDISELLGQSKPVARLSVRLTGKNRSASTWLPILQRQP